MADRPIIFSAPMVKALLDGRKTQTRRLLNPQPYDFPHPQDGTRCWNAAGAPGGRIVLTDRGLLNLHHKPHPGDRLYVRENWQTSDDLDDVKPSKLLRSVTPILYKADGRVVNVPRHTVAFSKTRPCIHMPRWASRLTLTVTEVRVERLQAISEVDAIAEGIVWQDPTDEDYRWARERGFPTSDMDGVWTVPGMRGIGADIWGVDPQQCYRLLWNSLHTAPGTRWADDPWVVAVTFDVAHGNIDGGQHG